MTYVSICLLMVCLSSGTVEKKIINDTFNGEKKISKVEDVKQIISLHFQSTSSYIPGDLITDQQVKPLFTDFAKSGWEIDNQDEILKRVTKSGSFMDRTMNQGNGRKFFRSISRHKNGIDRVERMSKLKTGRSSIDRLINKIPNGSDFIKALATTQHGKIFGQIHQSKGSKNFNNSTGKIYTEKQLTEFMTVLFEEEIKKRQKQK